MEIQRIGTALRVCAVDAKTGLEVVFQAPAMAGQEELKRLAAQKIHYVATKNKKEAKNTDRFSA